MRDKNDVLKDLYAWSNQERGSMHEVLKRAAVEIEVYRREVVRLSRNRDMWRDQCTRQAEIISRMREELNAYE